jgi:hypothetical protein
MAHVVTLWLVDSVLKERCRKQDGKVPFSCRFSGMVTTDWQRFHERKDNGLVADVFASEARMAKLPGLPPHLKSGVNFPQLMLRFISKTINLLYFVWQLLQCFNT